MFNSKEANRCFKEAFSDELSDRVLNRKIRNIARGLECLAS